MDLSANSLPISFVKDEHLQQLFGCIELKSRSFMYPLYSLLAIYTVATCAIVYDFM